MTGPLAIGVGCRNGCAASSIASLVERAWAAAGRDRPAGLFTVADKRGEPGLLTAAAALGLPLAFLPRDALAAVAPRVATPSRASEARFGLPSVSEAAALAGAGRGGRLVVVRMSADGATCAVAAVSGEAS